MNARLIRRLLRGVAILIAFGSTTPAFALRTPMLVGPYAKSNLVYFGVGKDTSATASLGCTYFKVATADGKITLKNAETIDNGTNGTILFTTPTMKHLLDSTDYWDATMVDNTSLTFTSVLNGTTGRFTFASPVTHSSTSIFTGATTQTGALAANGGIACDTDKFVVADTTGIVTLGGGGTIDNNTSASILNLTETTVRVTGAFDVTGNSTLASVDVGGGSGGSGATITTAGAATFDGAVTHSGTTLMTGRATMVVQPIIRGAVTDYDVQDATRTIAGLLSGFVTQNSKTGASTATTPTGTEISAGITGVATGDSFRAVYYNRGNQTSTITAGASGVTVYGTAAIAATKTALLYFVCTGANTWSCYVIAGA